MTNDMNDNNREIMPIDNIIEYLGEIKDVNNKIYAIMLMDNMIEHLKKIREYVKDDKNEEAYECYDGVVNASVDLVDILNELRNKRTKDESIGF